MSASLNSLVPLRHCCCLPFVYSFPSTTAFGPKCVPSPKTSALSYHFSIPRRETSAVPQSSPNSANGSDDEPEFQVLAAIRSNYNDIAILDTPEAKMLLLDSSRNIHSIFYKRKKWTGSYWDEFATLPAIVPKGPIAILGLGGGTAAHMMLELWPELQIEGWEIDGILVDKAREYLGLSKLETPTKAGGILNVNIGDALSPSLSIPGGYAGIIIDLFSNGKVLPQLQEIATFLDLNDKLMPNGRLMVNCGAATDGTQYDMSFIDGSWKKNATIRALCKAFPGQTNWKRLPRGEGENYLALTGRLPDLTKWSASLPDQLSLKVEQWRTCLAL